MFVYFGDEVAEALKSISKSAQVLRLWQDTNTHSSIQRRENGSTSRTVENLVEEICVPR